MDTWDTILRRARDCHTRHAWHQLFEEYGSHIQSPSHSKGVLELYRLLHLDPQCLQYDAKIWGILLEGCLSNWNLELGVEVSSFVQRIASTKTAIPAAKVFMESGQPQTARKTANRAMRLIGLSEHERLQLEMIICRSYVEEGKRAMAIRLLNKMTATVKSADLADHERSQFLVNMARTNFFLGRYPQAAELFCGGYEIYLRHQDWSEAARAVYNAASSFFNAGGKLQDRAFALVEECRRISEAHELYGPLSHVEAFYGHDDYWHGNFAGARDHYRRAYKYLPSTEKSFRTLHVLSMLAIIYLRTGQFDLARRFGQKTLELASHDKSERFRSRYDHMRAELMWESGQIEESQIFLREKVAGLISRGVNTLEELSTLGRYYRQCSMMQERGIPSNIKISEQLKKNTGDWLEYLCPLAQFYLGSGKYEDARQTFDQCLQKAKTYGDRYHLTLSNLGLIQLKLVQNDTQDLKEMVDEFEIALARLVETPVKVHAHFVHAGIAYRQGDFTGCRNQLLAASKLTRITYADQFVLKCWLETIDGHAARVHAGWQESLLGHLTWIYFRPSLKSLGAGKFLVSNHYEVDLSHHHALGDMMEFLMEKNKFAANPSDLQKDVWKQSLAQQGWQQKIRNSIQRLRALFPYTMAPLIVHDEQVRLFGAGIDIQAIRRIDMNPKDEILRLLREGPMSSINLANRINLSAATTKRLLKRLTEEQRITMMKLGRNVIYQKLDGQVGEILR